MSDQAQKKLSDLSTSHPASMRLLMVLRGIPVSFDHSCNVWVTPLCVIKRLLERLFCWTTCNTHRQFSLQYGPFTSILSKLCFLLGGWPMSSKNFSKESQRGSTKIPRAPYRGYCLLRGLLHRVLMLVHALYAMVSCIPCVRLRVRHIKRFWSELKHPQEVDAPVRRVCPSITFSLPQEHLQSQSHRRFGPMLDFDITVSRPNFLPAKSINAPMYLLSSIDDIIWPIIHDSGTKNQDYSMEAICL